MIEYLTPANKPPQATINPLRYRVKDVVFYKPYKAHPEAILAQLICSTHAGITTYSDARVQLWPSHDTLKKYKMFLSALVGEDFYVSIWSMERSAIMEWNTRGLIGTFIPPELCEADYKQEFMFSELWIKGIADKPAEPPLRRRQVVIDD